MSAPPNRLDLRIDVFEKTDQQALALPSLTPPELVGAILEEFRELEYLSDTAADYELLKADDRKPLDKNNPLGQQLSTGGRLVLAERTAAAPAGARAPSRPAYLREQGSGKVYKLSWLPALIGRPDKSQANNDWLAVNLASYSTGLRVSRRHARITEDKGQFFIESLSGNPTWLKRDDGPDHQVTGQKEPLQPGDIIHLEHSGLSFKFIVRAE